MQFKLDYSFQFSQLLSVRQSQLMLGSCFAEEVGGLMRQHYFDVTVNPHGILFNPISIADVLKKYMGSEHYSEADIITYQNKFYSLAHHGSFAGNDCEQLLQRMNNALQLGQTAYQKSQTLLITFGSAWVYAYQPTGIVVANCHKLPGNMFSKRLLTVDEILKSWQLIMDKLKQHDKQIVFTVSPVRYVRDGLHENNLSKSVLHLAVHALCNAYNNAHYFPAYEIVNDELRDYRFFKEDFVHPNTTAVKYVYERFTETACDGFTQEYLKAINPLLLLLQHRVLSSEPDAIAQHEQKINLLRQQLLQRYDFLKNRLVE